VQRNFDSASRPAVKQSVGLPAQKFSSDRACSEVGQGAGKQAESPAVNKHDCRQVGTRPAARRDYAESMQFLIQSWVGFAVLFVALLATLELGRRVGMRRVRLDPNWDNRGVNTLETALLALLGLLLAFTFSGAWSRFDARRELILREANAIGTAWLRIDLLPEPSREPLRVSFRRYLDLRIADTKASAAKPAVEVASAQQAIWTDGVTAARSSADGRVAQTLLPALNEMFDISTARYLAVQTHPPAVVFLMLLVIMLLSCLLAGYGMAGGRGRNWLHILSFIVAMILAIYVTVDLEYPRRGFVRVENYDQLLVDLRAGMK